MNRREFLKVLGLTAAAAAIEPARLVQAKSTPGGEVLVTPYSFLRTLEGVQDTQLRCTAYILDAPAGRVCRATFTPLPHDADDAEGALCNVQGVFCGNDLAQVHIRSLNLQGHPSALRQAVDAHVFAVADIIGCPVDVGVATQQRPLELEYKAAGDRDENLLIALWHRPMRQTDLGDCPPPVGWGAA